MAIGEREVRAVAGNARLPFDPIGGVMGRPVGKFNQLDMMAGAIVAEPQRHALLIQRQLAGIEISRGQRVAPRGSFLRGAAGEMILETGNLVRSKLEFDAEML